MNGADVGFAERMQRVDQLIRELEESRDPVGRERARELVKALLDVHAVGLARLVDAARDRPELVNAWACDPEVASLLLLHGLHPTPLAERVGTALAALAERLQGLSARVVGHEVEADAVRVRLAVGAGSGTAVGVRALVEDAVCAAAPDAALSVEVAESEAMPQGFVPLAQLVVRRA